RSTTRRSTASASRLRSTPAPTNSSPEWPADPLDPRAIRVPGGDLRCSCHTHKVHDKEVAMRIAVPTEIKNNENRVALTPSGADALVRSGHDVLIQAGAGEGSRIADAAYVAVGARIVDTAAEAWNDADLVLKVKEPVASEYGFLRNDLTLFAYLHLAADRPLTDALVAAETTAIAYETVQLADGSLPLLTPMSQIAGRLSVSVGAYHLMHSQGGRGALLGGVPGVPRGNVVVIGGGVAGENAAANAIGLGAQVTVFDIDPRRLGELEARYGNGLTTRVSTPLAIADAIATADLV